MTQSLRFPVYGLVLVAAAYLIGVRSANPDSLVATAPWLMPLIGLAIGAAYVAFSPPAWRLSSALIVTGSALVAVQFYAFGFRQQLDLSFDTRSLAEGLAAAIGAPLLTFGLLLRTPLSGRILLTLAGVIGLTAFAQLNVFLARAAGHANLAVIFDLVSCLLTGGFIICAVIVTRRAYRDLNTPTTS